MNREQWTTQDETVFQAMVARRERVLAECRDALTKALRNSVDGVLTAVKLCATPPLPRPPGLDVQPARTLEVEVLRALLDSLSEDAYSVRMALLPYDRGTLYEEPSP